MRRLASTVLLATLSFASSGCFTAGYLAQAAHGEWELLHGARPLREVVESRDTPAHVRELLARVDGIKAWGQGQGLKPTRNYDRYVDLHRPVAVWVVQACAPLSFDVQRWSFPLVGSVPYLGFFDEPAARRFADSPATTDLDVDVRTASAYSTLGWFRDPVLSTMLGTGDEALGDLVDVVLNESVHATLYVPGQSAFDESLASFVSERLTKAWLIEHRGEDAKETKAWLASEAWHQERVARLHQTWVALDALYHSHESDDAKRAGKAHILGVTRVELKLKRPLNNAALAGYETYGTGRAAFERLFASCGSWPAMFRALASLSPTDFATPQQEAFDDVLDGLVLRGCRETRVTDPRRR